MTSKDTYNTQIWLGTSGLVLPVPNKQAFPAAFRAGTRLTWHMLFDTAAECAKFASFIEWPPETFASTTSPLVLCLLGSDPVSRLADEAAAGPCFQGSAFKGDPDVPHARAIE